jgi:hypothetical protein
MPSYLAWNFFIIYFYYFLIMQQNTVIVEKWDNIDKNKKKWNKPVIPLSTGNLL